MVAPETVDSVIGSPAKQRAWDGSWNRFGYWLAQRVRGVRNTVNNTYMSAVAKCEPYNRDGS